MLQSIRYLRAFAALMVVGYHVFTALGYRGDSEGDGNLLAGGVDIFFVISGFVMVTATLNRTPSFSAFMFARIGRIVPLYWTALLIATLMLKLDGGVLPGLGEALMAYGFIPYTNPRNGLLAPFLVPGWTLNFEMLFYVIFGLTLRFGTKRQLIVIGAIFTLLVASRPLLAHYGAAGIRFTSPLFFEFLAGALIAYLYPRMPPFERYIGLVLLCVALIVAVALGLVSHLPRTVAYGLPATLIVLAGVASEKHLTDAPWLGFLGDTSYSIYLFHTMAIDIAANYVGSWPIWLSAASLFCAAVLVGIAAYLVVERPLLRVVRHVSKPPPSIA